MNKKMPNNAFISLPIIGYHRSPLSQKFGIPRQPNLVSVPSIIEMVSPFDTVDAFDGMQDFSHLWITWQTHHNKQQNSLSHLNFKAKVRPPRLGGNSKLGVFATRSTYRPSQLGLSVVRLIDLEVVNNSVQLHITGADMVDGTPIIDIKPYIAYSDAISDAINGFAPSRPALKPVYFSVQAEQDILNLLQLIESDKTEGDKTKSDKKNHYPSGHNHIHLQQADIAIISQLIAQDPRPAYRQQEIDTIFVMRYKHYDISFKMDGQQHLCVTQVLNICREKFT